MPGRPETSGFLPPSAGPALARASRGSLWETLGPCGLQQGAEWGPQVGRDLGQTGVQGSWGVRVSVCKVLLSRGLGQAPWMCSSALWAAGASKVFLQL